MDFSFTTVTDLETLTEYTREYATELTQADATIVDEVLIARTKIEDALGTPSTQQAKTHLTNACEDIELAIQIDSLEKTHQEELTNLKDAINRVNENL